MLSAVTVAFVGWLAAGHSAGHSVVAAVVVFVVAVVAFVVAVVVFVVAAGAVSLVVVVAAGLFAVEIVDSDWLMVHPVISASVYVAETAADYLAAVVVLVDYLTLCRVICSSTHCIKASHCTFLERCKNTIMCFENSFFVVPPHFERL